MKDLKQEEEEEKDIPPTSQQLVDKIYEKLNRKVVGLNDSKPEEQVLGRRRSAEKSTQKEYEKNHFDLHHWKTEDKLTINKDDQKKSFPRDAQEYFGNMDFDENLIFGSPGELNTPLENVMGNATHVMPIDPDPESNLDIDQEDIGGLPGVDSHSFTVTTSNTSGTEILPDPSFEYLRRDVVKTTIRHVTPNILRFVEETPEEIIHRSHNLIFGYNKSTNETSIRSLTAGAETVVLFGDIITMNDAVFDTVIDQFAPRGQSISSDGAPPEYIRAFKVPTFSEKERSVSSNNYEKFISSEKKRRLKEVNRPHLFEDTPINDQEECVININELADYYATLEYKSINGEMELTECQDEYNELVKKHKEIILLFKRNRDA